MADVDTAQRLYANAGHSVHEKIRCTCGRTIEECTCVMPNKTVKMVAMGCEVCQAEFKDFDRTKVASPRKSDKPFFHEATIKGLSEIEEE